MTHFLLTVRFLDNRYHGLLDRGGPPEWPPSPFRLFQALVAGVARRGELVVGDDVPSNKDFTPIGQALCWLQRHTREHPPIIIAPKSKPGQAITRFVPNNDGDKKFDRQERLTAKYTAPTLFLLEPDQKPEVHYVWDISSDYENAKSHEQNIEKAARSLTTLGWGIDMAFADARLADEAELQKLKGIRWYPKKNAGSFHDTLRTPTYDDDLGECTLCDLRHCHSTFINRIEHGKPLKTVDKPKVFDRVLYTSTERPIPRPHVVFKLVDENDDTVSYPHARLIHVAGMVRHLAIRAMGSKKLLEKLYPDHDQTRDPFRDGNPPRDLRGREWDEWVAQFVAGHRQSADKTTNQPHVQLSYVPLPSTGHHHTDPAIRRVMLVAPLGDEAILEHLCQRLDGQLLKPLPGTTLPPGTQLQRIPPNRKDGVRDAYVRPSHTWASFTPVILPGHDDHKPEKTRKLILKALAQAGIDQPCEFEWSAFSRFPKSFSAHKYVGDESAKDGKRRIGYIRPDHLQALTAVHLVLRFGRREDPNDPDSRWIPAEQPVPGPITIGAGRHCGFGLMAAVDRR